MVDYDDEENADYDDWEIVKGSKEASESEDVQEDVKMGETEKAMAYDEDLVFKHLYIISVLISPLHTLD